MWLCLRSLKYSEPVFPLPALGLNAPFAIMCNRGPRKRFMMIKILVLL